MEEVREDADEIKAGVPRRWFAVCEDMFDHPVVGVHRGAPPECKEHHGRKPWPFFAAWQWMIKEACWQPRTIIMAGAEIALKRGQFSHSQRHLARHFNWGEKAVREFLERLAKHGMVAIDTGNLRFVNDYGGPKVGAARGARTTIISISNYDVYQRPPQDWGAAEGAGRAQQGRSRGAKQYKGTRVQVEEGSDDPSSVADAREKRAPKIKATGSRLPHDWVLPDDWRDWALINFSPVSSDVAVEAEKFRDFWISKAGRDARKVDWEATWRNWCRNAKGVPATIRSRPVNETADERRNREFAAHYTNGRSHA